VLNVAVTLPEGWTVGDIVARAAARGLAVHALSEGGYYAEGPGNARPARPARLVIDYARPSDHAYPAAVAALVEALARRA
jgi:GntR family transcriptional regulator/MocR family aminotransferase